MKFILTVHVLKIQLLLRRKHKTSPLRDKLVHAVKEVIAV